MTETRMDEAAGAQMEVLDYLRIIRRRWPIVILCALVGLAVGYLTAKSSTSGPVSTGSTTTTYQATAILGTASSTTSDPSGLSLDAMAFLAQSGPVPAMTEKALGDKSGALDIAGRVQVTPKDPLNLMQVTASEPSRDQAAQVANAFASQVITYINDQLQVTHDATVTSDRAQLDSLTAVTAKLQAQPPSPTTQSELGVAQGQYAQLYVSYQELLLAGPQHTGLHVINPAAPNVASSVSGGFTHVIATTSKRTRTALGGLIGLIIGIGLALVRDRLDTKINSREQAERIFRLPVLGEIPRIPRDSKRRGLVVAEAPSSRAAESIRMLRTVLALSRPPGGRKGGLGNGPSRAILISSPTRMMGKGELIANLAASFSEAGSTVALVAVDPFDLSIGPLDGAASAMLRNGDRVGAPWPASDPTGDPAGSITGFEGVSLVMNGHGPANNGKVHGRGHADLVAEARRSAELVLVDVPPALITHEAGRLSAVVDSVVLVCEKGRVTAREAALTVDLLHRVGAPLHGIVLVAKRDWTSRLPTLSRRRTHRHQPQHAMSTPAPILEEGSTEGSLLETQDAPPQRVVSLPEPTSEGTSNEASAAETQDAPPQQVISLAEPTPEPTPEETSSEASPAETQDAPSDASLEH
ncbi:MAG TPA: hypothetical protein VFZ97_06325 [Acidimicrobiales bacterium]